LSATTSKGWYCTLALGLGAAVALVQGEARRPSKQGRSVWDAMEEAAAIAIANAYTNRQKKRVASVELCPFGKLTPVFVFVLR